MVGKYSLPELNLDLISEPHFIDNDKLLSLSLSRSLTCSLALGKNISHWDLSGYYIEVSGGTLVLGGWGRRVDTSQIDQVTVAAGSAISVAERGPGR